tara:strand:- start:6038 stop:6373 length:336 start_codon:yes stop_codon:yes gene_type:complete
MKLWTVLLILFTFSAQAQYKDGIVVIQYTASFVEAAEVNLDDIEGADQIRLYLTDHPKIFKKNNIVYLPTVILYHNRKTVIRVESNISLQLPENTLDTIQYHINKIIKSKF